MDNFSVLMSIYANEKAEYLISSLESILNQTIKPSEIVIIKDGPLPRDLNDIISEFQNRTKIVKTFENEKNLGLGLSLQKGILACSNEIIARMDTDDISLSNRFEQQLEVIEKGFDVVSCWSLIFEGCPDNIIAKKKRPENDSEIKKYARKRSPVSHAACMYRKKAILDAGNYVDCKRYEDYHLWARMIMKGAKFYNIQEFLYLVRGTYSQFGRRGGWLYLFIEIKTHLYFYKIGFLNLYELMRNIIIRIFVRISPVFFRQFLYSLIWKLS